MLPKDEEYSWRYRLLASVDITGSTAFKGNTPVTARASDRSAVNAGWVHVFNNFFAEFPRRVESEFQGIDATVTGTTRPKECLKVWKFVGDEILFSAELRHHSEAAVHLISLKRAVAAYEAELKKFQTLSLKATVWGAGFPVTNVEVEVEAQSGGPLVKDYLGPAIDLGFRLCRFADARRIPISIDVAYLLLKDRGNPRRNDSLKLGYFGREALKGVGGGTPYPVIWVDRLDGVPDLEDKLLNRVLLCDHEDLLKFIDNYYVKNEVYWRRPFIDGDSDSEIKKVPQDLEAIRQKLIGDDVDLGYEKSIEADDSPPTTAKPSKPPLPPPLGRARAGNQSAPTKKTKAKAQIKSRSRRGSRG